MAPAKTKKAVRRIPVRLPHAVRLLDSIDVVQRLNDAAVARRGVAHARNVTIESERLATHAKGPALQGLASIGESMRRGEQQMAADFAAAARRTPRPPPVGMTPAGSMTHAPATPAHMLRPLVPPTPRGGPPPLGPAPVPTPSAAAKAAAKAASRTMSAEQKAARNARLRAQRAAAKAALARVGAAAAAARARAASR
jgi:hypothetical protein